MPGILCFCGVHHFGRFAEDAAGKLVASPSPFSNELGVRLLRIAVADEHPATKLIDSVFDPLGTLLGSELFHDSHTMLGPGQLWFRPEHPVESAADGHCC